MGKRTSFNISVGFYPCQNQCYVDNVKLWFQKSATSATNDVAVPAQNDYTVYNLQGIQVTKVTNENDVNNLPAGLYIVNGKKVLVK